MHSSKRSRPSMIHHLLKKNLSKAASVIAAAWLLHSAAVAQPAANPEPSPLRPHAVDLLPGPTDPVHVTSGTLALLREIEQFQDSVATIHAVFNQSRYDQVFNEPIPSAGELWFSKPVLFRVDYSNPEPMTDIINEEALYSYVPGLKQVDMWPFESAEEREQQLQHLLIGFQFDTDDLVRRYHIASSADDTTLSQQLAFEGRDPQRYAILQIAPREAIADTAPFSLLKVTIDKQSHLPEKLWYRDRTGSDVEMTMEKVELDVPIDNQLFDIHQVVGRGVEFVNIKEN